MNKAGAVETGCAGAADTDRRAFVHFTPPPSQSICLAAGSEKSGLHILVSVAQQQARLPRASPETPDGGTSWGRSVARAAGRVSTQGTHACPHPCSGLADPNTPRCGTTAPLLLQSVRLRLGRRPVGVRQDLRDEELDAVVIQEDEDGDIATLVEGKIRRAPSRECPLLPGRYTNDIKRMTALAAAESSKCVEHKTGHDWMVCFWGLAFHRASVKGFVDDLKKGVAVSAGGCNLQAFPMSSFSVCGTPHVGAGNWRQLRPVAGRAASRDPVDVAAPTEDMDNAA